MYVKESVERPQDKIRYFVHAHVCVCVCMHLIHSLIIILLYKSEVLEGDFTPKPYLLVVTHSVSVYLYTV